LGITKTDSPDPVTTGSDVTYTITVTNNGPATATSVVVTDNLPANVTFVSCASTGSGVCGGSGNNRTVTFASLANGDSATITLVATANSAGGTTIDNTATISSATTDSNSANNSATANTSVQAVLPLLTINDLPTIAEGNSSTTTVTFTVTLSPSSTQTVMVNYTTSSASPATATAGVDYQTTSGTLTFNPGETSKPIVVTINGDLLVEPNETFFVDLSAAVNANISDSQGVGTILNDDASNLVISQIYGGGGNSGATYTHDFIEVFNRGATTVNLAGWSVQYNAAADTDAWAVTALCPIGPCLLAPGQYFLIQEAQGAGGTTPLPTPDATGTTNLAAASGKVALLSHTTVLSGACPTDPGIADMVGFGGTATCFEGAAPAPAPANSTADLRKTGGCTDTNDNAADFLVATPTPRNTASPLNDCSSADLGITKTDSPDPVTTGSDVTYTITVTNNGPATATSVVVTDNLPANVTFVSCASTGSGVCGGSGNNRTVTFASLANGDSATITLVATANSAGGTTIDNTATISSATTDSNSANNSATANTSVQAVLPLLTINDLPTIAEGNSSTTTVTFTVTLSPSSTQTVMVNYTTSSASPATATAGVDYQTTSGTLTFNPGETSKPIVVTINGDLLVEPNETFFVDLSAAVNANISDSQGVGTIINDDASNLVISQVYGGGGLTGATYTHDFVEIYNRGTTTVDFSITPYSVQYANVQAAFGSAKTDITSGSIAPGKYFLVQGASSGTVGVALPTPDATGSINLNATAGKVALVLGTVALAGNCPGDVAPAPTNPIGFNIVDFVGYGFGTTTSTPDCFEGTARATTASGTQNNRSVLRDDDGCEDTDDNGANFTFPLATSPPVARNLSTPANPCP
jgi:uncharacterized repeat protein (TIGR01451 family)